MIKQFFFFFKSGQHESLVVHQFSFVCIQCKCQTILFNPLIGPYQELSLRARVDLEAMAMKRYSAFLNAPALLGTHHQIV